MKAGTVVARPPVVEEPRIVRRARGGRGWPRLLHVAVHVAGVAALLAPLVMRVDPATAGAPHGSDAPILLALLTPALLGVAVGELSGRRLDAKGIALLGVLCGLNAALRVPGSFGGASLTFVLPILSGAVFGPSFGFLLGSLSFAVSGVVTAGIGPWLPFQMFAAGWVGAGAGLLRPAVERSRPWLAVAILCAYGYLAGFAFGAITDLWFWPFVAAGDSAISWSPSLGAAEAARRFGRFYAATSLVWDAGRAAGNAVLIALAAAPALRLLRRRRDRMWTNEADVV